MEKDVTKERNYWNNYYSCHANVHYPTSFSEFCVNKYLNKKSTILELGCGNGRDAFFFAEHGHNVIGIDLSEVAIENNNKRSKEMNLDSLAKFVASDFTRDLIKYGTVDVIYSRFSMHTITKEDEKVVIKNAFDIITHGGLFFIECRTINDPLFYEGKELSEFERYTDHYRRFIDGTKFLHQIIKVGFHVKLYIEDRNLAKFHNENPVVARYVVTKF
jgi:cyclopropane fatty-acyl-phospholipid synthase-like methyltransferase